MRPDPYTSFSTLDPVHIALRVVKTLCTCLDKCKHKLAFASSLQKTRSRYCVLHFLITSRDQRLCLMRCQLSSLRAWLGAFMWMQVNSIIRSLIIPFLPDTTKASINTGAHSCVSPPPSHHPIAHHPRSGIARLARPGSNSMQHL